MAKRQITSTANTRLPAYQYIKQVITANIHSGKWPTGSAIPSEHRLAREFCVSRMTVNRAVKELSEEKVLHRRKGSGTYVAQQQFNHIFVEVRNIAQDIKSNNQHYQAKVLRQRRLSADEISDSILEKLSTSFFTNLKDNASSVANKQKKASHDYKEQSEITLIDEVKIVHYADNQPIQLEERWVNAHLVPQFIEQDFSLVNTSDYLIAQAPLEGGNYTIRAVVTPSQIAQALNMQDDEPALLLSRQTYSAGQVVTFVNMWHAGHHYQISGTL